VLAQLEGARERFLRRNENAAHLTARLKGFPGLVPQKLYEGTASGSYYLYAMTYRKEHFAGADRGRFLKAIAADPETRWKITKRDWDFFKHYDRFYAVSEEALRETSTAWAPWLVVEGSDAEYRAVTVGRALLEAMRKRLAAPPERRARKSDAAPLVRPVDKLHILDALDLSHGLAREKYRRALARQQRELALLTRHPKFAKHTVVAVFEGMDAAGKGGAIRRITAALDARLYRVVPIAAPSDEERAQPYLWRFWRHVPRAGRFSVYDRSWYGRVLVERVEGFAQEADWMRAYAEINDFEEQLARHGAVVIKYWLQISKSEQHRRFKRREKTRHKQFKITPEDWRNREKWNAYQVAAADMIERTGTAHAPWVLVESNDKHWARVKILQTLVEALRTRLDG